MKNYMNEFKKIKIVPLLAGLVLALLLYLVNPFHLDVHQKILLSSLFFTVLLWATGGLHRSLASVFLLTAFTIFGKTPLKQVVSFAWSPTMLLIITSTLLSVGIMKSGIIDGPVETLLRKGAKNKLYLLATPYVLGTALIFLIPQAFSRVVILAAIYASLLQAVDERQEQAKKVLLYNCFLAISISCMYVMNGDIVLNYAALNFSGEAIQKSLSFGNWLKLMFVPSLGVSVVMLFLTYGLFRRELDGFSLDMIHPKQHEAVEGRKVKNTLVLLVMLIIIGFWMTANLHGISPWIPALVGVVLYFVMGILKKEDWSSINLHFLLFMTTAMSIGRVLGESGVSASIFHQLEKVIPSASSWTYLYILALVVMVLHMLIGSAVATMSVVLPILLPMAQQAGYQGEVITLMVYILVNIHFLLPFHHATLMIGAGKGYYPESYMLRMGVVMSGLSFLLLALFYFPWWKLLQLLH